MAKIKILPENLANKIAAGEVVQRPESVVKELIENSIDANATLIEVAIKKAGKSLIQVIDNGEGMSEEDAVICIFKHATSKIKGYEDLESIKTLGFRGEALSSIAAVSQFELKSRTVNDELGTIIKLDENQSVIKEKDSFQVGTSVMVKNLFYNTPARRNFLKTDTTELKHIIDTFNKIALSHPEIEFRFYLDDDLEFNYSKATLNERIIQVFGEETFNSVIHVEEITDFISLKGFVGKPSELKKSKGNQFLFLNNRYVQSKQINHAVFTAYEHVIEKGDYPFFILFLQIDPRRTDVNVHPSKLEIRFDDEKDVYNFVLAVVRKSLASFDLVPNLSFQKNGMEKNIYPEREKLAVQSYTRPLKNDFSDRPFIQNKETQKVNLSDNDIDLIFGSLEESIDKSKTDIKKPLPFDEEERTDDSRKIFKVKTSVQTEESTAFLVQLHNKYILSQIKSGLMIIDQHVAHERILYEKALSMFEANFPFSQQLLFPKTIDVDPATYKLIKEIYPSLVKLGFELKFFSKNTIVIDGVPQEVKSGNEAEILLEIVDEFLININEKKISDENDNVAKSFSCKAAIKAGDKLTEKEMRLLIDQLFATSMPYVCPHGRPIVVKISVDEFDRRFGRT
jgi:DNA mismatch repair protein MutL